MRGRFPQPGYALLDKRLGDFSWRERLGDFSRESGGCSTSGDRPLGVRVSVDQFPKGRELRLCTRNGVSVVGVDHNLELEDLDLAQFDT